MYTRSGGAGGAAGAGLGRQLPAGSPHAGAPTAPHQAHRGTSRGLSHEALQEKIVAKGNY